MNAAGKAPLTGGCDDAGMRKPGDSPSHPAPGTPAAASCPVTARAVLHAIEGLHGTVQVATALVAGGRRVDLAGLDAEAARVCLAVGLLPRDAALPLRVPLEAALRALDGLVAAFGPEPG